MNMQDLKAEHDRKQREKMLRENPDMPTGYCSCCGAPRIHGLMEHDRECIWWVAMGVINPTSVSG